MALVLLMDTLTIGGIEHTQVESLPATISEGLDLRYKRSWFFYRRRRLRSLSRYNRTPNRPSG